jgi:hypothetical protein
LYGLGHIKDERLNLAFESKSIKFKRPLQHTDQWFNILVLHQNKYKGVAVSDIINSKEDDIEWGLKAMQPHGELDTSLLRPCDLGS